MNSLRAAFSPSPETEDPVVRAGGRFVVALGLLAQVCFFLLAFAFRRHETLRHLPPLLGLGAMLLVASGMHRLLWGNPHRAARTPRVLRLLISVVAMAAVMMVLSFVGGLIAGMVLRR